MDAIQKSIGMRGRKVALVGPLVEAVRMAAPRVICLEVGVDHPSELLLVFDSAETHRVNGLIEHLAGVHYNVVINLFDERSSVHERLGICLLYTSPSPRDGLLSRMPSSA